MYYQVYHILHASVETNHIATNHLMLQRRFPPHRVERMFLQQSCRCTNYDAQANLELAKLNAHVVEHSDANSNVCNFDANTLSRYHKIMQCDEKSTLTSGQLHNVSSQCTSHHVDHAIPDNTINHDPTPPTTYAQQSNWINKKNYRQRRQRLHQSDTLYDPNNNSGRSQCKQNHNNNNHERRTRGGYYLHQHYRAYKMLSWKNKVEADFDESQLRRANKLLLADSKK